MKVRVKTNLVSGIFMMLFSILVWFMIPTNIIVRTDGLNAQFFPKLVIIVIFLLSCIQVFKSLIMKKDDILELNINNEFKVLLYGLCLFVYVFLIDKIGFLISSIFISILTLSIMKPDKKYHYVVQIGVIVFVYVLFTQVLNVNLP